MKKTVNKNLIWERNRKRKDKEMDGIDIVKKYVAERIVLLQKMGNTNGGKAMLASLRRGIGKAPGEIPELWGMLFEGFPEEGMSSGKGPTREEWAVYTALTLFALHQQGHDVEKECMHIPKVSLGRAVRSLSSPGEEETLDRVRRKFNIAATSTDIRELSHHLRGLIQMMRTKGIGMDYVSLAKDLYLFQFISSLPRVQLRWGEDFYKNTTVEIK